MQSAIKAHARMDGRAHNTPGWSHTRHSASEQICGQVFRFYVEQDVSHSGPLLLRVKDDRLLALRKSAYIYQSLHSHVWIGSTLAPPHNTLELYILSYLSIYRYRWHCLHALCTDLLQLNVFTADKQRARCCVRQIKLHVHHTIYGELGELERSSSCRGRVTVADCVIIHNTLQNAQ